MDTILARRLHNQLLTRPASSPYEVVQHMMCIQSQDLTQAKRAIASRCTCSEQDVIDAFNSGKIVRTWTQRGTIHTVASEDAGRMVRLCASKTLSGFKKRREFLRISDEIAELALDTLRRVLKDGKALTRDQIAQHFSEAGIAIQSGWNYHLLCYAGSLGLIVQGPFVPLTRGSGGKPKGFEQAFILYDERASTKKKLSDSDAVRELCLRYFTSHGPATIDDFARWSGLGKTVIKQGIADCGEQLEQKEIDGKMYYCTSDSRDAFETRPYTANDNGHASSMSLQPTTVISLPSTGLFLAGFDEFLLGYKDRTATLELDHHTLVDVSRNGVFRPTVIIDGKTIATRSIKHKAKMSEITIKTFETLNNDEISLLKKASTNYAQYGANNIVIHIV